MTPREVIATTLEQCKAGIRTLDPALEIEVELSQRGYEIVSRDDMKKQHEKSFWAGYSKAVHG